MLEEQMSSLVQAEMSVLVDILYHPEDLFHPSSPVHSGFMTKYTQLLSCSLSTLVISNLAYSMYAELAYILYITYMYVYTHSTDE